MIFDSIIVSLLTSSIDLMKNDQHQGKFHLLSIFLIPGFLVTIFLSSSWLWVITYLIITAAIIWITFREK